MKGLKKIALVSAIAAISSGVQAELKALDESTMSSMTGQAGLTIDLETKWTLGEFQYKDGGSVIIQNIHLGGNTSADEVAFGNANGNAGNAYLDNFRLVLDVAGSGANTTAPDNRFNAGMSSLSSLAGVLVKFAGNTDPDITAMAGGIDSKRGGLNIDRTKTYGDGDLVINSTFTDAFQKGGGFARYIAGTGGANFTEGLAGTGTSQLGELTYDGLYSIISRAVDFNFGFEVLGLASSAYNAGDSATLFDTSASARVGGMNTIAKSGTNTATATGIDADTRTTTLISDLNINGYFGPSEFVIQNKGNGFSTVNGAGTFAWGDAVSEIQTARYFRITDLDVYIDIAGVNIKDLKIHNERGDKSGLNLDHLGTNNTSSLGFAHAKSNIVAVKDNVLDIGRGLALGGGAQMTGAGVVLDNVNRNIFFTDGIKLKNSFKGDIDIPHLSFGNDGRSIGEIYLTDLTSFSNMTISAH